MRDSLIELINQRIENKTWTVSNLADYLLANGVIVPPCKVGDTVYVIYDNKVIKGKTISLEIVIEKDNISFIAGVNFFCYISMNKGFAFGVNVFLTREEAEAKLKGEQEW